MSSSTPSRTLWVGWIAFAGVLMLLAGMFNVIGGLAAVFTDDVFVSGPSGGALVLSVTGWGWVHLLWGLVLFVAGLGLFSGNVLARGLAVVLVALNMVTHMLLMPAYPFWSLLTIAIEVLVIWALTVHGHELRD